MPAGGIGCPPLPCLGRLLTHDDDNDVDDYDADEEDGDHDNVLVMHMLYINRWRLPIVRLSVQ